MRQVQTLADQKAKRAQDAQREAENARLETNQLREQLKCAQQTAGHLNHRQKVQYVAELKRENDALKLQLKEAQKEALREHGRQGHCQGAPAGKADKENGRARAAA